MKVDQVESVLNRLKKCETTIRATLTAFDPSVDQYQDEIPTMIMKDLKIRKNSLHITTVWRSQDIYKNMDSQLFRSQGSFRISCRKFRN